MHRRSNSVAILVLELCLAIASLRAQGSKLPFDVNTIIERVSSRNNSIRSREGEFLIDATIAYCPKEEGQGYSDVAFNGTNYLVVWEDEESGSWDIYGTRVSSTGEVLDPAGFAISSFSTGERFPAVAAAGSNWLVVWSDGRNDPYYRDICCARVSEAGIVIDPSGIVICTADNVQSNPAASSDGASYMVVWEDRRGGGGYQIYGARVDQSGYVYHPQGFAISAPGHYATEASISFAENHYLVTWQDGFSALDICGARVDRDGTVLDPSGIAVNTGAGNQRIPSSAYAGTNWLVVWLDTYDVYRIYGARVSQAGVVLDTLALCLSPDSGYQTEPDITSLGMSYFVIWSQNGHDIFGTRVTLDGVIVDSSGIDISTNGCNEQIPTVAAGTSNYLVTWTEQRFEVDWDVYGGRIDPAGSILDSNDILLSRTVNRQHAPGIAFGDSNYLVVWEDYRGSPFPDIYGARVNQSGAILDSVGFLIANGPVAQKSPSVAYDDVNYLVTWSDGDILGTRITQEGIVLDTSVIPISTASSTQSAPSVTFDGTNYFIVWQDRRNSYAADIYGARVTQSGTILDTLGIPISTAYDYQHTPSVAFDGTNYFVVWQDYRNDNWDVYGTRVSQQGIVLEPWGVSISSDTVDQQYPKVAFGGTNYMVVYMYWSPPDAPDIYGSLVDQNGVVIYQDFAICTAYNSQEQPALAFDGTKYFVLWQDKTVYYDIKGARLSQWGSVMGNFTLSTQDRDQITPALCHGQGEQLLMLYSGWTDSINIIPTNTMRIWGKFYPFVGIEEDVNLKLQGVELDFQIYPNPIQQKCNIRYNLPYETGVNISLFDVIGRLVVQIIDEHKTAGVYQQVFDMTYLPQGVYFVKLTTNAYSEIEKVIVVE